MTYTTIRELHDFLHLAPQDEAALEKLTDRERTIIMMRYGLGTKDGAERTQKEVADRLGISQSYISRLEKKIIGRLKKEMLKQD